MFIVITETNLLHKYHHCMHLTGENDNMSLYFSVKKKKRKGKEQKRSVHTNKIYLEYYVFNYINNVFKEKKKNNKIFTYRNNNNIVTVTIPMTSEAMFSFLTGLELALALAEFPMRLAVSVYNGKGYVNFLLFAVLE